MHDTRVCSLSCRSFFTRALLALACLFLIVPACGKKKPPAPHPPAVEVVNVIQRDIPIIHEWVGATDGLVNASIRPQVTGYLIKQNYVEGDIVKKGQVLFEIDPRPFQAALDQAKGNLAQVAAQWENAKANLARVKPLVAENALSPKDLDDATAAERSAKAQVVAAQAAVENARINLGFTRIISPINGVAGLATTQIGNLVGPALGAELTTVSTIQPIKIYYAINEAAYIDFMRKFSTDAAGLRAARKLSIELLLADGTKYPYKGNFYALDRQVDVRTGTLRVEALFPNPRNLLRPGQFVRVRVLAGIRKGALLVPQRAVTELQGGYQVAVVGPDNRAAIRFVKPGEQIGPYWVIEQGIGPGDRVVAEGAQKVRQGELVNPRPFAVRTSAHK
jgi:membrane fusion protein, multidrug efflux system